MIKNAIHLKTLLTQKCEFASQSPRTANLLFWTLRFYKVAKAIFNPSGGFSSNGVRRLMARNFITAVKGGEQHNLSAETDIGHSRAHATVYSN